MNNHLFVKPRAEIDLRDAYSFYEKQSIGLGSDFIRCVDAKLEFIRRHPEACQKKYKNVRRGLIPRFPFGIYYRLENDKIVIFSVLDQRQNPMSIQERMQKES